MDIINIFSVILLVVGAVASYKIWKKNEYKLFFYLFLLAIFVIFLIFWKYFAISILHFSGDVALVNNYIVMGLKFAAFLLVIFFVQKYSSEKSSIAQNKNTKIVGEGLAEYQQELQEKKEKAKEEREG